eukprot:GSChrysophyteH1.ASY1.ANO1.1105.1 assembled CDS
MPQGRSYRYTKDMMTHYYRANRESIKMVIGTIALIVVLKVAVSLYSSNEYVLREANGLDDRIHSVTWNMAAINNNPFEYWITNDDPAYNELMKSVSKQIESPDSRTEDVKVGEIFTTEMLDALIGKMKEKTDWEGIDDTRKIFSGFLTDPVLGKKRLISMTDRVTNTIQLANGHVATRPTVINCYESQDLNSIEAWWGKWLFFMFDENKYPAISASEEIISKPLQKWQPMRQDMCDKLNRNKFQRTAEILETSYSRSDVIFLQEVAGSFATKVANRPKGKYKDVVEDSGKAVPVSTGDLFAFTAVNNATNQAYVFASFHGDTNGLATIPVVDAVKTFVKQNFPSHKLLFGLDANTYSTPDEDQQGVQSFAEWYSREGLNSCWGKTPDPINFTTFHARTHLQSQLNKAVSLDEKDKKGDKNPKDFILFFDSDFTLLQTTKDNTGARKYIENMVFPTLDFPSDHGITSAVMVEKPSPAATNANLRGNN